MLQNPVINLAITDDHSMFRKGLISELDSFKNYKVHIEAENGKDLLSKLKTSTLLPDICILDIHMPEMDGYATMRELNANWPTIKVLTLTSYAADYSVIKMMKSGASSYICKDIDSSLLDKILLEIYHTGFYYSEWIRKALSPAQRNRSKLHNLTKKEEDFITYCCTELTYAEIAKKMFVSTKTLDNIKHALFDRLEIKSRSGLVVYAIRSGIFVV